MENDTEIKEIVFKTRIDGIFEDGTGFVIEEGKYQPIDINNDRYVLNKSYAILLNDEGKTVYIKLGDLLPFIKEKLVDVFHSTEEGAKIFSKIMKMYVDMVNIKRSAP